MGRHPRLLTTRIGAHDEPSLGFNLALEMHANFALSPLAPLPPGFRASKMPTRYREALTWGTLNVAGGAPNSSAAWFHIVP